MKRTPLRPSSKPLKPRAKPIRKINVKRARKRADTYSAYLKSATWKAKKLLVRKRSWGQCEGRVFQQSRILYPSHLFPPWLQKIPALGDQLLPATIKNIRCQAPAISCHHVKYHQTLGEEPIAWLLDLCQSHHDLAEAQYPWRAARRKAIGR